MDIYSNEEHNLLRSSVRDFAEQVIKPKAQELDEKEKFSIKITKKMGEMGFMGMMTSTQYGGGGMDTVSYILAMEEISKIDASASVVDSVTTLLSPVWYATTSPARKIR